MKPSSVILKFLFSILVLLVAAPHLYAQLPGVTYGEPGVQSWGIQVIPTTDGGFMVGGGKTKTSKNAYWVVKFSNKGVVQWDSVYTDTAGCFLWAIEPTLDNGALLAGYTGVQFGGQETALMFKIDSVGRVVKRLVGHHALGVHAHWFGQRTDSGYYWCGHTTDERSSAVLVLQRLDKNFNTLWDSSYSFDGFDHAHCGALTQDGGTVQLGHTSYKGTHYCAVRTDSNGAVVWSRMYISDTTAEEEPYGIYATKEGGFACFGSSFTDANRAWLLVLDSAGEAVINEHFSANTSGYSGIQTSDGGYLLCGTSETNPPDLYAVKTDAEGTVQWERTYGSPSGAEGGYAAFQHGDQYALVGEVDYTQTYTQLWTVFVDTAGDTTGYAGPQGAASVKPPGIAADFAIYPNPAKSGGTLTVIAASQLKDVELINAVGQRVYSQQANARRCTVNLKSASLAPGTYLIRATTSEGVRSAVISIQ